MVIIPWGVVYVLQSQVPDLAPLTYASKYVFKGETVSLDVHHNKEKYYTDENKPFLLWPANGTTSPLTVLPLKDFVPFYNYTIWVQEILTWIEQRLWVKWRVTFGFVWCSQSLLTQHVYIRHSSPSCSSAVTHSHIFVFLSSVLPSSLYLTLYFLFLNSSIFLCSVCLRVFSISVASCCLYSFTLFDYYCDLRCEITA